jgi:hypothetical protein
VEITHSTAPETSAAKGKLDEAKLAEPERSGVNFGKLISACRIGLDYRSVKLSLRTKLLLFIISISAFSMLVSAFILYSLQRQQLIENAESSTQALSNILLENLHHALQSNDWTMVNDVVQSAMIEEFETVRILSDEGLLGPARTGEVGSHLDTSGSVCRMCHVSSMPPANKTVIFGQTRATKSYST